MELQSKSVDTAGAQTRCDIVVTNGFVITMDEQRRMFAPGAIAIAHGRILAVGRAGDIEARFVGDTRIDAKGGVMHPGFIDPHLHIVHGTCRGVYSTNAASKKQPAPFPDWKADVRPEEENIATQLASIELLRRGFTCFLEPGSVFDGQAVAEGVEAVGIRALLAAPYLWDQVEIMEYMGGLGSPAMFEKAPTDLDYCLSQLDRELYRNKDPDALVRGFVAVYGVGTASDELLVAAKACSEENGVAFQQHENYLPGATRFDREALGKNRLRHLFDLGVLGTNTSLVHMNVIADDEVEPILQSGTSIVWCPTSTTYHTLAAGIPCRLPGFFNRGVNVSVAVDGALDATAGTAGAMAFHLSRGIGDPLTAESVIEMQTIAAAKVTCLDADIGRIVPGMRADVVIRNSAIEGYPGTNPVHQLAVTDGPGSVDTVLVNGAIVFRGGHSTRVDEEAVCAEAKASVQRRLARLGLSPGFDWPLMVA